MLKQSAEVAAIPDSIPDIREVLLILWRHRKLAMVVGMAAFILSAAVVLILPTKYEASSTIVLQDQNLNLGDFKQVAGDMKFDNWTIQTEVKRLTSSNIALQTIKALSLDKMPEFADQGDDGREVLTRFLKKMSVVPQGQSRVIEVSFKSRDPDLAAKIVNTHVDAYLQSQRESKNKKADELRQWFEVNVKTLESDITAKSGAVEKFRADKGLSINKDGQELLDGQISALEAQLIPLQVHAYDAQSRLAAADRQQDQSPYGVNHPKLASIRDELRQASQSADMEVNLLEAKLAALGKQADGQRANLVALNSLSIERDVSQKLLDQSLSNYQNLQSQVSFAHPDAVVVTEASSPVHAARPGKLLLLLAAIVFSACLSMAVVFGIEMAHAGLRDFEDVRKMGHKPLGVLLQDNDPVRTLQSARNSGFREAVKSIYMSSLMNSHVQTILVTSAMPQEGRTTFVISMGHYLASLGRKVIVIDADFLKPALSRLTASIESPGLADILAGKATLAETVRIVETGLAVIPAGKNAAISPDALRSDGFLKLLKQLKSSYDFVLIDSGPLLAHTESRTISGQVDGIIVVAEWVKTSRQNLKNMFSILAGSSVPVLGVVMNKVEIEKYKTFGAGSDFLLPRIKNA